MMSSSFWGTLDSIGFRASEILLSTLWQSSILIVAVAVLGFALRHKRAAVRRTLWIAVLCAVPMIPLLTWAVSAVGTPTAEIPVMPSYTQSTSHVSFPAIEPELPANLANASEMSELPGEVVSASLPAPERKYPWAIGFLVYAAGALTLLTLVGIGRLRFGRWIQRGRIVTEPHVLNAFRAAAQQLRLERDFTLIESHAVHAPMAIGILHPVVLMPSASGARLPDDAELHALAVHELAHIKRHDPLVLTLVSLARAVLFFHPLIWFVAHQISALAEQVADDAVIEATGKPVQYARMLARLAEHLPRRAAGVELAAGLLFNKSAFLQRVEAVLSDNREKIKRLSRIAVLTTVLLALLSFGLALALPLGEKSIPAEVTEKAEDVGHILSP